MSKKPPHTFRITPWRPWLLAMAISCLLAVLVATLGLLTGSKPEVAGVVLLILTGFGVVLLLPIGLTAWVSRWHVDARGLGGRNNWLVYRRLDWDDITSVDPWPIPGYRYVQVNAGGDRWVFWVPLFLTDMAGFRAAVAHYAPPDNPLRRYLENHPA